MNDEEWWNRVAEAEERRLGSEESQAITDASGGLQAGDLQPLARYLRSGFPLHHEIRRSLVELIEGQFCGGLYKPLRLEKNRRGPGNRRSAIETLVQYLRISHFVIARLPTENFEVEAAVNAAAKEFDVSRATVMKARRAVREWTGEAEQRVLAQKSTQKRK